MWSYENFLEEYQDKKKYLSDEDNELIKPIVEYYENMISTLNPFTTINSKEHITSTKMFENYWRFYNLRNEFINLKDNELFDYLVATDELDNFLGLKDEFKSKEAIDLEIKEVEEYIDRLKTNGTYTEWQKNDLKYNENRLKALKELRKDV